MNGTLLAALLLVSTLGNLWLIEAKVQQPYNELQFNSNSITGKRLIANHESKYQSSENGEDNQKQIEVDNRLIIVEPYKSLIQTTARFALTNTNVGKHLDIDIVMNFLNDAGYLIAKPVILFTVAKVVTVLVGILSLGLFFLPGAPQFLEAAWKNPAKTFGLKKYLSNGVYERSILKALNSRTEELLASVGLDDETCRQKSICHVGETIMTMMPQKTKTAVDFLQENFSNIKPQGDIYFDAFSSGLINGDCSSIMSNETRRERPMCLGHFVDTFLLTTGLRQRRTVGL